MNGEREINARLRNNANAEAACPDGKLSNEYILTPSIKWSEYFPLKYNKGRGIPSNINLLDNCTIKLDIA
jgi:hypothetical protein